MKPKDKFNEIANLYIRLFEEKHEIDFDYWIGDEIGGVADFNSYCLNYDDVRRDIDEEVDKTVFFAWYDYNFNTDQYVNYKSWLMNYK